MANDVMRNEVATLGAKLHEVDGLLEQNARRRAYDLLGEVRKRLDGLRDQLRQATARHYSRWGDPP